MYLLQISDSHHQRFPEKNQDHFHEILKQAHSLREKLEKLKGDLPCYPDLICHCGDLCHSGDLEDYQDLADLLEEGFPGVPVVATPGNHDNKALARQVFAPGTRGAIWNNVEFQGLRVLSFDNTLVGDDCGEISQETCEILLKTLNKHQEKPCILLTHHHLLPEQSAIPPCVRDSLFETVLAEPGLKAIFTGHSHYGFAGKVGPVPYYTAAALSFRGVDGGDGYLDVWESSGYHLFSWENGAMVLKQRGCLGFGDFLGRVKL